MDTGLHRTEWIEPAGVGGHVSGRTGKSIIGSLASGFAWLSAATITGLGMWVLLSGYSSGTAESEPVRLASAVAAEPAPVPAAVSAPNGALFDPMTSEDRERLGLGLKAYRIIAPRLPR